MRIRSVALFAVVAVSSFGSGRAVAEEPSPNQEQPVNSQNSNSGGQLVKLDENDNLKNHVSLGMPLTLHFDFTLNSGSIASFIGLLPEPELRYSRTLTPNDRWRLFIAVRWTGLLGVIGRLDTGKTLGKSKSYDAMAIIGGTLSFRTNALTTKEHVTFATPGISLGIGFGSVEYAPNKNVVGLSLNLSVDFDLVSFNF